MLLQRSELHICVYVVCLSNYADCFYHWFSHNHSVVTEIFSFQSDDGRLMIYCCDLFKVDATAIGKFDAVWDRGSLVAIFEEDRER